MRASNISIPAGGEKPPTKEPPKVKNPSTTRETTKTEERANLECPDKEIRDHTTEPHRIPTREVHPTKTATKQNIRKHRNKQKESPKMGRQKANLRSEGMEDSPLKELNEMEVTKLSDVEFKLMGIKMLKELTDNYKELSENYISMK